MKLPGRDQVHVWRADLDAGMGYDDSALSTEEVARADRFLHDHDRRRFIAGRCFMRARLAAYLCTTVDAVRFMTGHAGKPRLASPGPADLRFNISHCKASAVLAVSVGREVGVDVEVQIPEDFVDVARLVMTPCEHAALIALADSARPAAFLSSWTRKEALVKAFGAGLTIEPRLLDVGFGPNAPPRIIGPPQYPGVWSISGLVFRPEIPGAIAVAGERLDIVHCDTDSVTGPVWGRAMPACAIAGSCA